MAGGLRVRSGLDVAAGVAGVDVEREPLSSSRSSGTATVRASEPARTTYPRPVPDEPPAPTPAGLVAARRARG